MRIQRTFSKTWENLKTPDERAAKAKELAEARKEINARRAQIQDNYKKNLKNEAFGKNIKHNFRDKEGKLKNLSAEDVKKIESGKLEAWVDSIRDTKHRTPKSTPKPKTTDVLIGKAKKLAENPKARKWGAAAIGATAGTLAVSGIDKAIEKKKEKKKENEMKSKFSK